MAHAMRSNGRGRAPRTAEIGNGTFKGLLYGAASHDGGGTMRILTTAMLPFLLIACGESVSEDNVAFGPGASDGLQAGSWALSTTLGTPQNASPGREPPLTVQQCLNAGQAEIPARDAILSMASRSQCGNDNVRFERGTISGALTCQGVDDIPEHQEQISGSYTSASFHMTIDMPFHGLVVRQTIDARRTGDC